MFVGKRESVAVIINLSVYNLVKICKTCFLLDGSYRNQVFIISQVSENLAFRHGVSNWNLSDQI